MVKKIFLTLIVFTIISFSAFCVFADSINFENDNLSFKDSFESFNLYAEVINASDEETLKDDYSEYKIQKVRVKILDERYKGKEFDIVYYLEDGINTRLPLYDKLKKGDKVYAYAILSNGVLSVDAISYYDKTPWVLLLFAVFCVLIILFGGKNGLKAILSLCITIALIFWLLIPGIISGKNIILLTVLVCSLTTFLTFIIISGFNKKSLVAIVGTVGGIVFAAFIGFTFSNLMRLTGINEHARMISTAISEDKKMISFKGIMLSAIMISAMGACMDVGMSISSSLCELKSKKVDISKKELIKSGMNIGKDVMGTMTNTLILAYVGSAMLCILLYNIGGFDLAFILNAEDITDEILKSLSGSMGLACTIPITAFVGGTVIGAKPEVKKGNKKETEESEIPVNYFKG